MSKTLERHAEQLAALGHPARLALLRQIVQGGPEGMTTTELQEKLDIPWTTLNHHLDRLVDGGLVATRREGKFAYHTAQYDVLRGLTDFLWEDCCKRGKSAEELLLKEGSTTMNVLKPHVSLNVSNIDASVAFYEKAFGVTATKRRPGYAKFDLLSPSLNLTMQEAPRTGVNASHFGIQVASTEDVATAWTRFKEAGLKTLTEENTECCYALQDKVWVEDPDGNAWEVFVVKGEAAVMEKSQTMSAGCCVPKLQEEGAGAPAKTKASGGCCG